MKNHNGTDLGLPFVTALHANACHSHSSLPLPLPFIGTATYVSCNECAACVQSTLERAWCSDPRIKHNAVRGSRYKNTRLLRRPCPQPNIGTLPTFLCVSTCPLLLPSLLGEHNNRTSGAQGTRSSVSRASLAPSCRTCSTASLPALVARRTRFRSRRRVGKPPSRVSDVAFQVFQSGWDIHVYVVERSLFFGGGWFVSPRLFHAAVRGLVARSIMVLLARLLRHGAISVTVCQSNQAFVSCTCRPLHWRRLCVLFGLSLAHLIAPSFPRWSVHVCPPTWQA